MIAFVLVVIICYNIGIAKALQMEEKYSHVMHTANILSEVDANTILSNPASKTAFAELQEQDGNATVYFSLNLDSPTRLKLASAFPLLSSSVTDVPMRWVRGDTAAHEDSASGGEQFEMTHLVYVTAGTGFPASHSGTFVADQARFDLAPGSAFAFSRGLRHAVEGTTGPRLMIGPMSESGMGVGAPPFTCATGSFSDTATQQSECTCIAGYAGSKDEYILQILPFILQLSPTHYLHPFLY